MLPAYIQIIEKLKMQGHTVVSEHVASEVLEETEAKITDEEIFKNDLGYIDRCECLVAEVTVSSIGVGYEIGYAVSKGKLVLCIIGTYLHDAFTKQLKIKQRTLGFTCLLYRNLQALIFQFFLSLFFIF